MCYLFVSVLEILRLVNQRNLLLADTHIQELERECELDHRPPSTAPPTLPTSRRSSAMSTGLHESVSTSLVWDAGRRKAKDVELLYEALLQEMWDVVRESLRQPCAGPQLGLVVLVIQQEEQADSVWAQREKARSLTGSNDGSDVHEGLYMSATPSESAQASCRPRALMKRWEEAVGEAADWSLPQPGGISAGQLASFLERLSGRVLEDLDAACRNVVAIYPEDFRAFQVYVHSYHKAVAQRLKTVTSGPLQITDTYALLDWIYNIYRRYCLCLG